MEPDENMMESRPTKRSILDVTHGISKRKRVELSCPICLRDFEDVAMIHPCCHIFCFGCISKWILQKSNCPLCKKHVDEIKHGFRVTRSSLGLEPKWTDRGEIVSARHIIEEEVFKRLLEHTWLLESEIELISTASKRITSLIPNLKPTIIGRALELRIGLDRLHYEVHKWPRLDVIRHPLFRFVAHFMDADRHTLITTHTDVVIDENYVKENRARLRSDLLPFVVREVHAITGLEAINIQKLMDLMLDTMENPNQRRDILFDYLRTLGVDHPRTFYKHVQDFVASDQSLLLYDTNSRYKIKAGLGPAFTEDNDEIQVISAVGHDDVQYMGISRISRRDPQVITLS